MLKSAEEESCVGQICQEKEEEEVWGANANGAEARSGEIPATEKVRREGSVTVSGWAFPLPSPTDSSQLLPSFRVSLRERASQSDGAS